MRGFGISALRSARFGFRAGGEGFFRLRLGRQDGAAYRVEYAVDKANAFVAAEAARQLESFVDYDRVRQFVFKQLKSRQTQNVAIDRGHAIQAPVFAGFLDAPIESFPLSDATAHQVLHELIARHFAEVFVIPVQSESKGLNGFFDGLLAQVHKK